MVRKDSHNLTFSAPAYRLLTLLNSRKTSRKPLILTLSPVDASVSKRHNGVIKVEAGARTRFFVLFAQR